VSRTLEQWLIALVSGLLFGAGLVVGGMTDPRKVIGFLDIGGAWDPSLAFVMLGAVTVHFVAYRWVRGNAAPLFADEFAIPTLRHIDRKLVGGSALFGVGWGLAGYCPGPSIVSLGAGGRDAFVFVVAMFIGMFLVSRYESRKAASVSAERYTLG
jgi:uncharacterized membrane protein YedE/YeeE